MEFTYSALHKVIFSEPAEVALPRLLQEYGYQRPFLVASKSLATATAELEGLREALPLGIAGLSTGVSAHTPREDALALLDRVRSSNADVIVSIGGGSVIDACKFVQLAMEQDLHAESDLVEYAQQGDGSHGSKHGDFGLFSAAAAIRQIAIPTTLSGAEFSNNAGILNTQTGSKEGYKGPHLCPQAILYDPILAAHTPQWLWLSTSIRSLDHAVEGYCSGHSTPFLDGHFLHAMRLFSESLPTVKESLSDAVALNENQQAVWLACCGLGTVPHGASHGIGYILGSLCGVPHGYTSCVMLPAVLEWNQSELQAQMSSIAAAMGRPTAPAHAVVKKLIASLGLPTTLREVKVPRSKFDEIAARAFRHPVVKRNPRAILSVDDVRQILELAW